MDQIQCKQIILFCLLYLSCGLVQCRRNMAPKQYEYLDEGKSDQPLILTPYIEGDRIDEGRKMSKVILPQIPGLQSYSGFFTVDKKYDSNMFFWYFPASNTSADAPVILWLQGGPGVSSMFGLLCENGPIQIDENDNLENRAVHWATNHHVIYIDNPVGAGFSFTNNSKGYSTNETHVAENLHEALSQFFQLFPELQKKKLFISGESYAGKYVPALSYMIHTKTPSAKVKMNLTGLAIGNGFSDPVHQSEYAKYLYQLGLIDVKQFKILQELDKNTINAINNQDWVLYQNISSKVFDYINKTTGDLSPYNFLLQEKDINSDGYARAINKTEIRRLIHVGQLEFNAMNKTVYRYLTEDMIMSVTTWISELLDYYDVLIYSGQLDIIVAYPLTLNFIQHLNYTGAEEYKSADRIIWKVGPDVAGYMKRGGRLVEVLVRDAGHMVPADQPVWALDLITRFTYQQLPI